MGFVDISGFSFGQNEKNADFLQLRMEGVGVYRQRMAKGKLKGKNLKRQKERIAKYGCKCYIQKEKRSCP